MAGLTGVVAVLARPAASGLPRLRWMLGLFAGLSCGAMGVISLAAGRPWAAVAAAVLVLTRFADMRRGRLGHPALDPVEGLLLVTVVAGLGIDASSAAVYTALYFRAAYAGRARLLGSVVVCLAALEIGAALTTDAPFQRAAQHVVGLLMTGTLMHVVLVTLLARERQVVAEREFLDAVLESLDVAVVACDTDGRTLRANRAAREADLDPRQVSGGRPELLAPVLQPLAHALQGRTVRDREVASYGRAYVVNAQPVHARVGAGAGGSLGAVMALHDVTERRRAEEQLVQQAVSDPLTGLPNRLLVRDRLDRSLAAAADRGHRTPALLVLDLDGFKAVNDSAGHDAGDEVLLAVAGRLASALSAGATLARLGGDEFAVLLEETGADEAVLVARRLLPVVAGRLCVRGLEVVVTASIGVALPEPGAATTSGDLLRNADLAMYAAKEAGGSQVQVYDPGMHASVVARTALERGLRRALDECELVLHYQPVVSYAAGGVVGVEALVRWQSPERGLVAPQDFIPLAEATGLIVPLGAWVLEEACRQVAAWDRADDPALAGLHVAVNVSVRQLLAPGLLDVVRAALDTAGVAPERLVIEITESALGDAGPTLRLLQALRDLGVQLSLDDFGTGYSSLARLRLFPVHTVKVDRSFVQEIEVHGSAPLVSATLALAKALGLATVAEGVETPEQEMFLRAQGCEAAQGYRYSRPRPAGELASAVREIVGLLRVPAQRRPLAPAPLRGDQALLR